MKRLLLLIVLSITFFGQAQFNKNAPWTANDPNAKNNPITIDDEVDLFTNYWESRDKDKKGSGYKPFMRWEYQWRNNANSQGYLITPQEIWDAYNQKKNRSSLRNTNANTVLAPPSNWIPVGPFTHTNTGSWSSGQGRVNVVYQDPTNPNTLYIGTPAGGVWKSINSGDTWIPLSDELPQIGVSGIAVDPNNASTIYIATGDPDASDTYSIGVLKSTNGGATWNTTGLTFTATDRYAGDILINPTNSNMLWCATNSGIYRTINAGVNWTLEQTGDFSQGRIRLKPGDPNTVYAVSNNRFYRSTNSGDTFTIITTGLPTSSNRLIMDVTPANANYIYILSATTTNTMQGIYRSTDGGTNWTKTSGSVSTFDGSTQAWYDMALAVSPTNVDEVYTGVLNVWKSTNSGAAFTKLNNWNQPTNQAYTHADIHYLKFFGNTLYCGSDGGVFVSQDGGFTFTDKTSTAQISQYYKIAVSKQTASKMVGGLQDNGGYALSNNEWKNYYGADGMDTAINQNNSNLYYGFIQNGNNLYISNSAGNSLSTSVAKPAGETGNWVTPLVSNSVGQLFAGYTKLYILIGGAWEQQSSEIGTGSIELVTVDPSNDDNMYATNGDDLYKSTDRGLTFSLVYTAPDTITSVEVHSSISNTIYIVTRGTGGQALKSTDGGLTFNSFNEGLPNIGKYVIVHQGRNTTNPLFLGTTLGVYYRDDTMTQWEPFDTNLPNVPVRDLEINLEEGILVAATYGRGIWQTAIPVQVPLNDVKLIDILSPSSVNVNCSNTVAPQISVKNNGSNPITTVTFNYSYNGVPSTFTWNGLISANQTVTINLPQTTLSKGAYNFLVTSTIPNDMYNDNNTAAGTFYLNDIGIVNVTNTFENPTDELLENDEGSSTGLWVRGIRSGSIITSGTNNVYTTSLTGNYPDEIKSYLISGCYNLSQLANPLLSFKMAFDLENNWDILYVQYSTDFGQTWEILGQQGTNWYNSNRTPETSGTDCNNCVGAQWTGTDAVFKTYSHTLVDLNSEQNIIFRFVFQSDQSVTNQGIIIDDFLISGVLASDSFDVNTITIYPNPSNGIYNIKSYNDVPVEKIEVHDVMGKIIAIQNNVQVNYNNYVLDLTQAASGIYFVTLTSNNQKTIKRIIKK